MEEAEQISLSRKLYQINVVPYIFTSDQDARQDNMMKWAACGNPRIKETGGIYIRKPKRR